MNVRPTQRMENVRRPAPAQPANRAAAYPYREEKPQLPPELGFKLPMAEQLSDAVAAEWLLKLHHAEVTLRLRLKRLHADADGKEGAALEALRLLTAVMNELLAYAQENRNYLNSHQKETLLQAMRASEASRIGLIIEQEANWHIDEALAALIHRQEPGRLNALVSERGGLYRKLLERLAPMCGGTVSDIVIESSSNNRLPYFYNYNSQFYWPFPASGRFLNRKY
ncbi:hypothetical protein [Paenibacillus sp. NPDC058071]|uniref:hypothetical protein n=1 Tax=Paenibacillus sp. NPDC058071 TaxID=3346326 RepID=UPI0036DD4F91